MRSSRQGFTLIELMVTLVVIAILAAVAYPAYQDQILRAKRAEGKAALLKAAQLQERNYLSGDPSLATPSPTYLPTATLAQLFGLLNGAVIYSGENPALATGAYTITVNAIGGAGCTTSLVDCFVLSATPNPLANFTDIKNGILQCGVMTLNNAGGRTVSGTLTVTDCWSR